MHAQITPKKLQSMGEFALNKSKQTPIELRKLIQEIQQLYQDKRCPLIENFFVDDMQVVKNTAGILSSLGQEVYYTDNSKQKLAKLTKKQQKIAKQLAKLATKKSSLDGLEKSKQELRHKLASVDEKIQVLNQLIAVDTILKGKAESCKQLLSSNSKRVLSGLNATYGKELNFEIELSNILSVAKMQAQKSDAKKISYQDEAYFAAQDYEKHKPACEKIAGIHCYLTDFAMVKTTANLDILNSELDLLETYDLSSALKGKVTDLQDEVFKATKAVCTKKYYKLLKSTNAYLSLKRRIFSKQKYAIMHDFKQELKILIDALEKANNNAKIKQTIANATEKFASIKQKMQIQHDNNESSVLKFFRSSSKFLPKFLQRKPKSSIMHVFNDAISFKEQWHRPKSAIAKSKSLKA